MGLFGRSPAISLIKVNGLRIFKGSPGLYFLCSSVGGLLSYFWFEVLLYG